MKKETKPDRYQVLLRVTLEEHARLTQLGQSAGFSSANKFILEAVLRYGDILSEAIIAEDREADDVREKSRERLRSKIQSSRR